MDILKQASLEVRANLVYRVMFLRLWASTIARRKSVFVCKHGLSIVHARLGSKEPKALHPYNLITRIGLRLSLVSIFFILTHVLLAQQPVQISTALRPPYTLQLSDYYASTQEKLVVSLTNRDLNKPILNVRLRMTIESQSVQLRSREFAILPTLQLEAGVPLRLSLGDLAPYFAVENLDFSGISRAHYTQQVKLPEGFYQFCFEAIEVSTNQVASSKSCGMAWISLSDPPFLNLPRKGEAIALKEPQNIIFQWTPRHLNSPNAAYVTEYDFQLVELWDNALAPEVAFQSMQPLYETTTRTTTLLYGPSQPLLIPGKRYGWRIKAHAKSGIEEVDVFRNQGFSEIYWFTYQDVCPPPLNATATPGSFGSLEFSWTPSEKHKSYMVTYRLKDKEGATWFDQQAPTPLALVYDVEPGLEYEYRVGAFCTTDQPVFGELRTVTLPARKPDAFMNCSIVPNPSITNKQGLQTLKAGDVITAGDFPVKLSEVSGTGTFTGKGYVTVPFLGKARVGVKFDNIQVNTQNQLMAGQVITTYNEKESSVLDVDGVADIFRGYEGIVSRLKAFTVDSNTDDLKKVVDKIIEAAEKELPKAEADSVKKNADQLIATKTEYAEAKKAYDLIPAGDENKAGAKTKVDELEKKFEEIKSRFEGKDGNTVTTTKYVIEFAPSTLSKYGFDKLNPAYRPYHDSNYDFVQKENELQFIAWKAVPIGGSDWVKASSIDAATPLPKNVVFKSSTGMLTSSISDKELNVKVYGYTAAEKTEVFAYQQKEVDGKEVNIELGKLNVVSYQKINSKLVIVPVNTTTVPYSSEQLKTELDKIYGQAVVEWSVEVRESFSSNYDVNNNGLDDVNTEMFSNYTGEMETIIDSYTEKNKLNDNTYYLFLVPGSESKVKLGYMPRKKKVGFVFMDLAGGSEFIKTLAHELGHGAFRLEHTFDTYPLLARPSTDNLMDYKVDGLMLHKYQWDLIHDPAFMISLFEDDESGAFGVQLAQCLAGAGLDFAFYYTSIWITAHFDDELGDGNKPGFTEFSAITSYKEFSWKEALISAGISCGAATLPPIFAPETSRKIVIGFAALGGAATGFATETAKQYDVAYTKLLKQTNEKPSLIQVVPAIDWKPVILSSAVTGVITGTATWLATSPKFTGLVTKIKDKLKIKDLVKEKQKLIDYLSSKITRSGVGNTLLAAYAGKATRGIKNILALESPVGFFRQLKGKNGQTYRAATFWTDEGVDIIHYISADAKYYIKHDPSNGRVLFIDAENNKFMGFMLDQDNIIGSNYSALVEKLKTIHGLPNSGRYLTINGTTLTFAEDKANLILGKYNPNGLAGISGEIGTDDIISQMLILKNYSFADKIFELRNGSVHVLNIPDGNVTQWATFFEDYNKQFLDLVIQNSDKFKVTLVSDPRKIQLLRAALDSSGKYIPSGFAKEIKYLRDRGIKNIFLKDGTQFNLDKVDLSTLNWAGWLY